MPNWVYSHIAITGSHDQIQAFKKKAGESYSVAPDWGATDGALLFWNFKKPDDLAAYTSSADREQTLGERLQFAGDNWYDWNIRNWGTKWDACDSDLVNESEDSLDYQMATAWSIPTEAFEAMVSQHPELVFEISCQEEQGWGAELRGKDGILSVIEEWDIPDSHAECSKRHATCACEWADDPTDFYPDCPDYVAPTPAELSESQRQEQEMLAKMRETVIEKSGVSQDWADKHLEVVIVK